MRKNIQFFQDFEIFNTDYTWWDISLTVKEYFFQHENDISCQRHSTILKKKIVVTIWGYNEINYSGIYNRKIATNV